MYSVAFAVISVWCLFLLDDLSFYLQRLSTDFTVFFLRHAGGICPCPDFTLYSEVGDNMEYAVFSDDRIFVTATLENALIRRYFVRNSNHYRPVLQYFRKYWKLIFTNFLYILGLYIHNFVFWTTDMRMEIAKVSYVTSHTIWHPVSPCLPTFPQRSSLLRVWR